MEKNESQKVGSQNLKHTGKSLLSKQNFQCLKNTCFNPNTGIEEPPSGLKREVMLFLALNRKYDSTAFCFIPEKGHFS